MGKALRELNQQKIKAYMQKDESDHDEDYNEITHGKT